MISERKKVKEKVKSEYKGNTEVKNRVKKKVKKLPLYIFFDDINPHSFTLTITVIRCSNYF